MIRTYEDVMACIATLRKWQIESAKAYKEDKCNAWAAYAEKKRIERDVDDMIKEYFDGKSDNRDE